MKILFIGGTGTISMAITRQPAERGDELYLLNRGNRNYDLPENVNIIQFHRQSYRRQGLLGGI